MCPELELTTDLVKEYLKLNKVLSDNVPWEIRRSPLGDRGVFATRNIQPGELIFIDCPIIIGPRVRKDSPQICVVCYKSQNIKCCARNCGLPVCSELCENSEVHKKECDLIAQWKNDTNLSQIRLEIVKCLTPIRSLCLSEVHKRLVTVLKSHTDAKNGVELDGLKSKLSLSIKEEDLAFMRVVCSILDTNAFEVLAGDDSKQFSLRGLYTLGSLVNHNCSPNTIHVFDEEQRMVVRAATFIPKNAEIFHSYTRLIWNTLTRRHHLLITKNFCCLCERCRNPEEFGGYLNALLCEKCKGHVLPINPLKSKTEWMCFDCRTVVDSKKVGFVSTVLGQRLQDLEEDRNVDGLIKFWKEKLSSFVPETNHITVQLKYRLVWIFGYEEGYLWTELSNEYLRIKEEICRDLLDLLLIIRTGNCKMRGLLLYELFCCLKEKHRRSSAQEINNNNTVTTEEEEEEMKKLLAESADILQYDVGAPGEVKRKWDENKVRRYK